DGYGAIGVVRGVDNEKVFNNYIYFFRDFIYCLRLSIRCALEWNCFLGISSYFLFICCLFYKIHFFRYKSTLRLRGGEYMKYFALFLPMNDEEIYMK